MRRKIYRRKISFIGILIMLIGVVGGSSQEFARLFDEIPFLKSRIENVQNLESIPTYDGESMVVTVNDNQPTFTEEDLSVVQNGWQTFSELDGLNRVGPANALLHKNMMPNYERGDISNVYPSGWNQKQLSHNEWLYDRCHLIGFQFTGENDNWKNLFTGTAQMNRPKNDSMLEYENKVAGYLRKTGNYVRYRVTPYFIGEELVCRGVQMEAQSIEDDQLRFNIFVFNRSNSVTIDYATGRGTSESN